MIRRSKLALALVVLLLGGGILLVYSGTAVPMVDPGQLPGDMVHAVVAVGTLVFAAIVLASYLDRRGWARMGREVGLSPAGGLNPFGTPDLTGRVGGREMRVRTYTTSQGRHSSQTHTVVETPLPTPVDWRAVFLQDPEEADSTIPDLQSAAWTVLDGEFAVVGDVPEETARAVLTARVRDLIVAEGAAVSVGDMETTIRQAVLDTLPADGGGMAGGLAEDMLELGMDGQPEGPAQTVELGSDGLLLDDAVLHRRMELVGAVADAVEMATEQPAR